jgi:type VI secretion system secreted protein VgrG
MYHINYVLHSASSTESGELLLYQNTAVLQDAQSPWRGLLNKAPRLPLVFQAKIESRHEQPYLNANGRETVRSLLDSHSSKNMEASIPIPRLTPYAHASGGLQFPLYPGAEVLMTCLHGELDLPVILGAVFNDDTPSPVNNLNPWVNLIKTQQQQTFMLDDSPGAELISLSTQSGHTWVMTHGNQPGIFVKCVGGMIIKSQGRQAWHTGEHFNVWAGQTYTQQAMHGQLIRTLRGHILLKSHLDMKLHALRQIEAYAKRHAAVFCRQLSVQVKGNQMISVEQGNAIMKVQGAQKIETNKNMTISSLQGDITWTNLAGNCGLVLTQTGTIRLFGNQMLLSTELQKNAATINHR